MRLTKQERTIMNIRAPRSMVICAFWSGKLWSLGWFAGDGYSGLRLAPKVLKE